MTQVTHPLEYLNQIEVISETEKVNSDMVYYNNTIRPVLVEWWKDISKYCSYCNDGNVSNYFWYRTLSLIYGEYAATFSSKAIVGEEHEQAEQDARDLAEFMGTQCFGFSDLYISMQTPLGDINFGLKEGQFGIHLEIDKSYEKPVPLDARVVESKTLISDELGKYVQNVCKTGSGAITDYFEKLGVDKNAVDKFDLAARFATGNIVGVKEKQQVEVSRDSAGNLQFKKRQSTNYDLAGYLDVTSDNIQVGKIKARRDVATYGFLGGFFSVSAGNTVIRLMKMTGTLTQRLQ